ncbi:Ger(x)C family spore germination protein [Paenibacillus allorhizosphaerae]
MAGLLFVTAGCEPWPDNNIIEEIAPVIFWSIDQGPEGKLKISTLTPPLSKEEKKMLTLNVDLLKQGKKAFNQNYYRELKSGQLRMLLISEEVARNGVRPIIDTVLADPEISMRLYLAVYRGDLLGYLQKQIKKEPLTDYFLYRKFKHYERRSRGEITVVNLHQFMKKLYSPLADPVMPVYRADQDNLTYEGTGLFTKDKLVSVLGRTEEQMFQLLYSNHRLQELTLPELSVNVSDVHAKPEWKVDLKHSSVTMNMEIRCRIEEYHGNKDLLDPVQVNELNRNIGAYMDKQTTSLLKKMQEMKVDPLNLGTFALGAFHRKMDKTDWQKEWPQIKVEVKHTTFMEPLTNALSGSR